MRFSRPRPLPGALVLLLPLAACHAVGGQPDPDPTPPPVGPVEGVPPRAEPALPPWDLEDVLQRAHDAFADLQEGANADYIPVLAEVDPELFGVALVTVEGREASVGDARHPFSIQSISKVFALCSVLHDAGEDEVLERIGVNATGQPFNSIIAVEIFADRAVNSFVNPGAIATTSLVEGDDPDAKWEEILGTLERFANRDLEVDQEVYASESATNGRNRAIALLLDSYGRMYDDPATAVDLYTRQCSVRVDAEDLAMMAATLANGGTNPVSGEVLLTPEETAHVLSVMATAGMYDTSGTWLWRVGLPAKSGVGGGILAVCPGRFGIAAFSPRLDEAGNSVRSQRAIEQVVRELDANLYRTEPR